MLGERFVYALTDWTVEKRASGWYFSRSANPIATEIGAVPTARRRVSR